MQNKQESAAIGARMKSARKVAGVTQEEAAAAAGVTRPTISNWEAGRNLPHLLQFRNLMALYGSAPFHVLFGHSVFALTRSEHADIKRAFEVLSPSLSHRLNLMLQLLDPEQTS